MDPGNSFDTEVIDLSTRFHPILKENAAAFVVVRLNSTRFTAKQMRPIGGKTILQWIIHNLRQCGELDDIVLATVAEPANQPLRRIAEEENVRLFWYDGHPDHVTTRLRMAAEAFAADICVLVSGDCPLIHAPSLDQFIACMRHHPQADVLKIKGNGEDAQPAVEGYSVICRKRAWILADDLADRPEYKEHQFPVINLRPEHFSFCECAAPSEIFIRKHRLSVDTFADLEFMNVIHRRLEESARPFTLPNALRLIKENPEIRLINQNTRQRSIRERIRNVLIVADAGGPFGFGHLMRTRELALQITERLSWPVTFVVDHAKAVALLTQCGLGTIWGAWGRPTREMDEAIYNSRESMPNLQATLQKSDLLIFDIPTQRDLPGDWRDDLPAQVKTLVIDNTRPWTRVADLTIIPGIRGNPGEEALSNLNENRGNPEISGLDFLILRREIARSRNTSQPRQIDILAYLPEEKQKSLQVFLEENPGLKVHVISAFSDIFPILMAQSRIFLSGFGYGCYESLYLGAIPVVWPHSKAHEHDARIFFRHFGIHPWIIESSDQLCLLNQLLNNPPPIPYGLKDGTVNIIRAIAGLWPEEFDAASFKS